MSVHFQLDHFVVAVQDLGAAVQDYERLGFTVSPGGRHTHAPTHNALVYLQDGAYFELIEWLQPAEGEKWYERLSSRGEGVIDFALCPDDLCAATATAGEYGYPVPGSRVQADGLEIRWQLGWPATDLLPFLCGDLTPRVLRVPEGACRQHANGIVGVHDVSIRVVELDVAVRAYRTLLQVDPTDRGDARNALASIGLQTATFTIGASRLNLVASVPGSNTLAAKTLNHDVQRYGPGLYKMTLAGAPQSAEQLFDQRQTHGVAIQVREHPAGLLDQVLPVVPQP